MGVLSGIRSAAIVIDRNFIVREDNGFAQRAPENARTFAISATDPPILSFKNPQHQERVRAVIEILIASGAAATPDFVVLAGRQGRFRIVLHIVPLPNYGGAWPDDCCFMLLWRRLSSTRKTNFAAFHREFGLSPAEVLIVEALGRGQTIEEFAAGKGISPVTARNQLRSASAKLGVTRQAEIAALYAELSMLWPLVGGTAQDTST